MGKGTDEAMNYVTDKEAESFHFKVKPTPEIIKFLDVEGNTVGRLFIKDGTLDFEGDATESAKILFDGFKRHIEQQLMEVKPDAT